MLELEKVREVTSFVLSQRISEERTQDSNTTFPCT